MKPDYAADRKRLEAMLDARMSGEEVLSMLPNPAMKGFNANKEARNAVGQVEGHNHD